MAFRGRIVVFIGIVAALAACRAAPAPPEAADRHPLTGQILLLRPDIREVRIHHDPIPGYMGEMTMSLGVQDAAALDGLVPGDLVEATLVVTSTNAWLEDLRKTGHAPLPGPEDDEEPPPLAPADLLAVGDTIPDLALVDQAGRPWRPIDLRGHAVALTFIDTRCPLPTSCPLITRAVRETQQLVSRMADVRDRVRFVSISFDPASDTPEVLTAYAEAAGADLSTWTFVTAGQEEVERYVGRFGVAIVRNPDRPADVRHTLRTVVVAPDGRIARIYSGSSWTPTELAALLAATAAGGS